MIGQQKGKIIHSSRWHKREGTKVMSTFANLLYVTNFTQSGFQAEQIDAKNSVIFVKIYIATNCRNFQCIRNFIKIPQKYTVNTLSKLKITFALPFQRVLHKN